MAYVLIFCLIVALIVLSIFVVMDMYGNKYILDMKDLPIDCDTVIILGAGIRPDGNPCDLLADRLDTGAKVYVRRICKTILLTGDNSGENHNELDVLLKLLPLTFSLTIWIKLEKANDKGIL